MAKFKKFSIQKLLIVSRLAHWQFNLKGQVVKEKQKQEQILQRHNQMFMSPQDFCFRWDKTAEELAQICGVSQSTTNHWLGGKSSRRSPGKPYQRILAIADFLLSNPNQIHPLLERWFSSREPS